jgi:hypothetical protein
MGASSNHLHIGAINGAGTPRHYAVRLGALLE